MPHIGNAAVLSLMFDVCFHSPDEMRRLDEVKRDDEGFEAVVMHIWKYLDGGPGSAFMTGRRVLILATGRREELIPGSEGKLTKNGVRVMLGWKVTRFSRETVQVLSGEALTEKSVATHMEIRSDQLVIG